MGKIYTVEIEVPSGSRIAPFFVWLGNLLRGHRMKVIKVHGDGSHHPGGEDPS